MATFVMHGLCTYAMNKCGWAGINVDDLLLKKVAFFLAESYGHGLKTPLRQKK